MRWGERMVSSKKALAAGAGVALLSVSIGCPDGGGADREMTIVVEADTEGLQEREGELTRQLDEIEAERARLMREREGLIGRMESGDDLSRLISEQRRLLEQEQRLRRQETLAEAERAALTEEVSRIVEAAATGAMQPRSAGADEPADSAPREADLARREAAFSERERDLAEREKALAEREARLALREADAAHLKATSTEAATAAEPGRRVASSKVEAEHRKVRQGLRRRGILLADLPPEVAALDRRVYQLSRLGRWEEALDAVESLSDAVSDISIDETFIQSKMARLGRALQGKDLSADQGSEVEDLLAQATSSFADGDHSAANARLNRIAAILSD